MASVSWVIKASKLCNLRCAYCSEWDQLGDPARLSLDLWSRVLRAIRWYEAAEESAGRAISSTVILHGGEPLALPTAYLEQALSLIRSSPGKHIEIAMQTNLYRVRPAQVDLINDYAISVGVSLDVVSGVRLTQAGRDSEFDVINNLDELLKKGIKPGGIAVVASHTAPRILDVYEFYRGRGMSLRFLPLFDGPTSRSYAKFETDATSIVEALKCAFDHHFSLGGPIGVIPLDGYMRVAVMDILGLKGPTYYRDKHGESVIVVNTDGKVFIDDSSYCDETLIGDLSLEEPEDIFGSSRYVSSLAADRRMRDSICSRCEFYGACNTYPSLAIPVSNAAKPCPVAQDLIAHIKRRLLSEVGEKDLRAEFLSELSSDKSRWVVEDSQILLS